MTRMVAPQRGYRKGSAVQIFRMRRAQVRRMPGGARSASVTGTAGVTGTRRPCALRIPRMRLGYQPS